MHPPVEKKSLMSFPRADRLLEQREYSPHPHERVQFDEVDAPVPFRDQPKKQEQIPHVDISPANDRPLFHDARIGHLDFPPINDYGRSNLPPFAPVLHPLLPVQ